MTLDQLEMLEAIVEKGTFKAAADHLHKSQPSLSVGIRKIEEEYGLKLFDRAAYRPKLTAQGRVLYDRAKDTLGSFRRLDTLAKEMGGKGMEPHLRVVVDPLAPLSAVEAVFRRCTFDASVQLTLSTDVLDGGVERLLERRADFAIAPKLRDHEDIESVKFANVELVPVIARSLAGSARLSAGVLLDLPRIVVVQDPDDAESRRDEGPPRGGRKCFVTDHALKEKLIIGGFGWGRLPKDSLAAAGRGALVEIDRGLASSRRFEMHIMRNRLMPLGLIARALWADFHGTGRGGGKKAP